MSDAYLGHGSTISRGTSSSGPWTAIAETRSITPPQLQRNEVEVTHTTSPDGYREYIGGLKDGSRLELTVNYLPSNATHQTLLSDYDDDVIAYYRVVYDSPTQYAWIFQARVLEVNPEAIIPDDAVQLNVSLKTTGPVTRAAA